MRAIAVYPQDERFALITDHPEPKLRTDADVELKVLEVGICGTDKEIASFQYGTPPEGEDHLVIGHESLSEVVRVGSNVRDLKVGDLVVAMVRRPCDHDWCSACQAGRQDFCYSGDFTERGIKGRHGYMTERVVVDARYLVPVPADLRHVGVLTEPLTIAEKALIQVRDIQERLPAYSRHDETGTTGRHRALVLGAGPVGILGAMALVTAGYDTVVYSMEDAASPNAKVATGVGARYLCAKDTALDHVTQQVGRIDLIYEATGASRLAFDAMQVLGTNGVFVFTGVPGRKAPIEVDTDRVMRDLVLENQVFLGTVNAGRDAFAAAVRDLAVFRVRWPEQIAAVITGRYPMERHADLLRGEIKGIKNVIQVS